MFIITEVKNEKCKNCQDDCKCKKENPQDIVESANTIDGRKSKDK